MGLETTLVVYDASDEVLITTLENEANFLTEWFNYAGRNICDYERSEKSNVIQILPTCHVFEG